MSNQELVGGHVDVMVPQVLYCDIKQKRLATHSCMTAVSPECPQVIPGINLCLEIPTELF